ncbi:DNA replication licensing factor MCM8 [Phytophthora cinnamomi]|uniref:DNA replication licensing factor MCM8 n=1 Tax=Phytophthora cinnamomi TaxID=4785 RepID=UPI003559E272|nr:DNA replication licensing factor MCM8 [Phytophthora cinnamomi]
MRQYGTSPSSLVDAATCVWNQYYPEDHNIGTRQPGETRSAQYYSPISDTDGRFQAALTFLTCFRDGAQWAPLLQCDLTQPNVTVVWLPYAELIRTGTADFERALTENIEDVLLCLGIALCMRRHELRVEAEEDVARQRSVPVDRTKITVRLHGVTPVLPIAALKADVVNQFVSVVGTVVRVSAIKPLVTRCDFVCAKCNEATSRAFPDGKFVPPQRCETAPCRGRTLLPNRSSVDTVDYQKIKLQEMETTDVGPGRMPRMIEVELYEDLVDTCIPGNVVTISGIVKSINSEIHEGRYGKRAQANSLYILYICANSVENSAKVSVDKDKDKASDIDFTKEDLEQISNIINQGNVFDRLVHSLCPGIYRNDIVKAGLILALLGGTRNTDDKDTTCVRRADSHVLVVGDPGLGKSQMLRAVSMVAPRAVYVGGNTTTTTGLTVTMVKDGSGDYALEAGALVLADQGVCCIDEFDKMGIDYQALLEAMEQQSISIAKAGIVCNLNARTSVIAAANPSGGHYDRSRSVGENLKMKAALLSRFDLVFILLDRPDEERDRLLSEHVMNSHARGRRKSRKRMRDTSAPMGAWSSRSYADEPPASGYDEAPTSDHQLLSHRLRHNAAEYSMSPIPLYFVRKFIAYARRYVHPRLSSEAAAVLQKKYLELRSAGEGQQNPTDSIPITTRQLESLIRLSQARARAELAETVSAEHAQDVVDIMQECLLDTLVTEDGNLDFGRSGGMSLAKKVKAYVARLMKAAARRNTSLFTMDDLLEVADSMGLKVDDFRDFVDILRNECYLLKKGPGQFKVQVSSYNMM